MDRWFAIAYLILLGFVPCIWADEISTKTWSNNAEVSLVSANGNAKATTTKVSEHFKYEHLKALLDLQGSALGSDSQQQVTAEEYRASEKMGWKWTERDYLFENVSWNKNRFAGLQGRADPTVGYGRKILDGKLDKLTGEAGVGYTFEKHTDETQRNYASGRAFLQYVRHLSSTSNFNQEIEYLPRLDDASDFHLRTKTSLTASIITHLALQASYEWNRQNRPPAGFGRDDTLTSTALVINY